MKQLFSKRTQKAVSTNYLLLEDEPLELPCKSTGNPKPDIVWFKDGSIVTETENFKINDGGSLVIGPLGKL